MNKRSDSLTVTDIIRDRALNCTREFIFPRPNGRKSCSGRFSLAQLIIVVLGSQSYSQIFRNDTQIVFFYGVLPYSGDKAGKNKVILSYFRQCPVLIEAVPINVPPEACCPCPMTIPQSIPPNTVSAIRSADIRSRNASAKSPRTHGVTASLGCVVNPKSAKAKRSPWSPAPPGG